MAKRIPFQGEELTLTEVARRLGVGPSTIIGRMRRGETLEQAISYGSKRAPPDGEMCEICGVRPKSGSVTCGDRNCQWRNGHRQIQAKRAEAANGQEQPATRHRKPRGGAVQPKPILFRGEWMSRTEVARLLGCSLSALSRRLARLASIDAAVADNPHRASFARKRFRRLSAMWLRTPRDVKKKAPVAPAPATLDARPRAVSASAKLTPFNGELLPRAEIARRLGISESALSRRFSRGASIEDAISGPPHRRRRFRRAAAQWFAERRREQSLIVYGGIADTSAGWARRLGVSKTTMRWRLETTLVPGSGWTLERALTEPPSRREEDA